MSSSLSSMAVSLAIAAVSLASLVTVAQCDAKASHLSYAPEYVSALLWIDDVGFSCIIQPYHIIITVPIMKRYEVNTVYTDFDRQSNNDLCVFFDAVMV